MRFARSRRGCEELAPGQAIQPHRHLLADEIIFVHRGTGQPLGDQGGDGRQRRHHLHPAHLDH